MFLCVLCFEFLVDEGTDEGVEVRYSYPHNVWNDRKRGLCLWVLGSMGACGSGLRYHPSV